MAVQDLLRVAIVAVVASQSPCEDGLVARAREQEIWVLWCGRERGDPATVTAERALEDSARFYAALAFCILLPIVCLQ